MKKLYSILCLILVCISSCGTFRINKTSDFTQLSDTNTIDGYYFNWIEEDYDDEYSREISLLSFFKNDSTSVVNFKIKDKDKLLISYENEKGKHELIYEGKVKKKFIEIYFNKKQLFIPLIFSNIDVSRVRIGKTKKGELLVNYFENRSGNLLLFAGGEVIDRFYRFRKVDFDKDIIPIKIKDKWGILDEQKKQITPFIYDMIIPIENWGFKAYIDGKAGILDKEGKVKIPIIYDYIKQPKNDIAKVRLNNKWGYITKDSIIIPAIYTQINDYDKTYFLGKRNNQIYFVDKDGYEYECRGSNHLTRNQLIPDIRKKRKISLDEQEISE